MQQQRANRALPASQHPDAGRGEGVEKRDEQCFDIRYTKLRQQLILVWAAVFGLLLALVGSLVWSPARELSPPLVLTVERLEIVEPDGSPAMILANSQRSTAATIDGQVLMEGQEEERKGTPSIIFFDGKEDEVGGMLFGTRETPDGYQAGRHLSLSGFHRVQVRAYHKRSPGALPAGYFCTAGPGAWGFKGAAQCGDRSDPRRPACKQSPRAVRNNTSFPGIYPQWGVAPGIEGWPESPAYPD